jgi:hypothetical protein
LTNVGNQLFSVIALDAYQVVETAQAVEFQQNPVISVLLLSPYAYQKASWLVPAPMVAGGLPGVAASPGTVVCANAAFGSPSVAISATRPAKRFIRFGILQRILPAGA